MSDGEDGVRWCMMVEVCQMVVRWYRWCVMVEVCQMVVRWCMMVEVCQMVYDGVGWLYREELSDGEDGTDGV